MAIKTMYNYFTNQCLVTDLFGPISNSQQCALEQIRNYVHLMKHQINILNLSGDNDNDNDDNFTKKLQHIIPNTQYNSSKQNNNDLVLAHFNDTFIPIGELFTQAQSLTNKDGYLSIITSTYESFPFAQQNLANFINKDSILSNIVGHYYKSIIKNAPVAANQEELLQLVHTNNFNLIAHERLRIPIRINTIDELSNFGIDGAWFLNAPSLSNIPKNILMQRMKRIFNKIFTFPYQDTHVIDVLLMQKKSCHNEKSH